MPRLSNSGHEVFAQTFVAKRSFKAAALAAGSEADNLSQAGVELYERDDVRARIAELTDAQLKPVMTSQRLLTEIGRMASVEYSGFFHPDGTQKGPHELTADQSACVRGTDRNGRYQFWDKNPPAAILAKHFKIIGDEGEGVSALASALADRLNSARKRTGEPARPVIDSTPDELEDLA